MRSTFHGRNGLLFNQNGGFFSNLLEIFAVVCKIRELDVINIVREDRSILRFLFSDVFIEKFDIFRTLYFEFNGRWKLTTI